MALSEKERLLAILMGKVVDRPAVICPGGMMSAATTEVLGKSAGNFHTDPEVMAEMAKEIHRSTGFDNLGVPFCMTVEAEAFGSQVDLGDAAVEPRVMVYGVEELETIIWPDGDSTAEDRLAVVLKSIEILSQDNPDLPVIGNITGPVSLATSVLNPMQFFRLMRKEPAKVHGCLDYITDFLLDFARRQITAGADVIAIADPTSTGEIIGMANFREFVTPRLVRLVKEIKALGVGVIVHICGDATVLLAELNTIKGAALSFDSMVDMRKAKEKLTEVPLMGNISTQLLHRGSSERIVQAVDRNLNLGIDIISPACGISLQTPLPNLRALTSRVKALNLN